MEIEAVTGLAEMTEEEAALDQGDQDSITSTATVVAALGPNGTVVALRLPQTGKAKMVRMIRQRDSTNMDPESTDLATWRSSISSPSATNIMVSRSQ